MQTGGSVASNAPNSVMLPGCGSPRPTSTWAPASVTPDSGACAQAPGPSSRSSNADDESLVMFAFPAPDGRADRVANLYRRRRSDPECADGERPADRAFAHIAPGL